MKPMIGSAAWAACLWLSLFAPGFSQTETDRSQVEPAWGEEVRGILAGLVVEQAEFESGENVGIMIALHVHNDNPEQVTLPTADGEAGWRWEFYLSGGGNPFVARWNDDTGGMGAGGGPLVLEPGASKGSRL
jgi:hypothetical protein